MCSTHRAPPPCICRWSWALTPWPTLRLRCLSCSTTSASPSSSLVRCFHCLTCELVCVLLMWRKNSQCYPAPWCRVWGGWGLIHPSYPPFASRFNDAQRNVIVSVVLAGLLDVPEVCIFMDARLLRGNRTVKHNSGGLDAFDSPNFPPLATLETGIRFRSALVLSPPKGRFRAHTKLETNIAVWRYVWFVVGGAFLLLLTLLLSSQHDSGLF